MALWDRWKFVHQKWVYPRHFLRQRVTNADISLWCDAAPNWCVSLKKLRFFGEWGVGAGMWGMTGVSNKINVTLESLTNKLNTFWKKTA